jgi:aryl-alcohol dehydrogenase-like predicted oxidoreductase
MDRRPLGQGGPLVSPVGFGAVKIGRNTGLRYPSGYDLPSEPEVARLLNGILDLGINLIDTAPAYGSSEERIGRAIGHRRAEFVLSTKAGEQFDDGISRFDFGGSAIRRSLEESLRRLRTDRVDVLLLHSDGRDLEILEETDAVPTLLALRSEGLARQVGLSGKTIAGARAALAWADVLMVPYNLEDRGHAAVIEEAHRAGVGVLVKKGLGAGRLGAAEALRFALAPAGVSSVVVGSLSLDHLREDVEGVSGKG